MTRDLAKRNGIVRVAALAVLAALVAVHPAPAAAGAAEWTAWSRPEDAGFSSRLLAEAKAEWDGLDDSDRAALFLVFEGKVLASFGDASRQFRSPTVRSTLLSALFGAYVDSGEIDLDATLAEVGVNDIPPLTAAERRARIVDLLTARSGVYHQAACESQAMRDSRPPRGSHAPGTFWYYNNWDVNALGTVFWRQTGREVFAGFEERIARPLGMEDFRVEDCNYNWEMVYSLHPCYWFRMSVRDRARLGQLFLQNGRWGERQILSAQWVAESTRRVTPAHLPGLGFGYMWWTLEPEFFASILEDPRLHHLRGFAANDFRGQLILVVPDAQMVVALGAEVAADNRFAMQEAFPLLEKIVTGREIVDLATLRVTGGRRAAAGAALSVAARVRNHAAVPSEPSEVDFFLAPARRSDAEGRWMGTADLDALAAGRRKTVRSRVLIPADLSPGKYFLVAVVDSRKDNYDLRRGNNAVVATRPLRITR